MLWAIYVEPRPLQPSRELQLADGQIWAAPEAQLLTLRGSFMCHDLLVPTDE